MRGASEKSNDVFPTESILRPQTLLAAATIGGFGEAIMHGNATYRACMAGQPLPAPRTSKNLYCVPIANQSLHAVAPTMVCQ